MKVLVLGASGMIGSAMFRELSEKPNWQVWGTFRSVETKRFFADSLADRLLPIVDVEKHDLLVRLFARVKPDVVVNCIGLTKHHREADDPLLAIPINALFPHRLADLCAVIGAKLIHISTDCVFSGSKGHYVESDVPDALDVYGKSKSLGEVDYPHAITLRTSTIGHELQSAYGLLEWFLLQKQHCKGFTKALFSGLTNIELARVVRDIVIPHADLHGLYHVGGPTINKFDLLCEIAKIYGKKIDILPENEFVIDRSLDSGKFYKATGYASAAWTDLIQMMHATHNA